MRPQKESPNSKLKITPERLQLLTTVQLTAAFDITISDCIVRNKKEPIVGLKWRALKELNLRCNPAVKHPSVSLCCSFARGCVCARVHRHPPESKLPLASHSLSLSIGLGFLRGVFRSAYSACGHKFSAFPYTQGAYMTQLEVTAEFHRARLKQVNDCVSIIANIVYPVKPKNKKWGAPI